MCSFAQETARRRKKRRGHEIASYILMGGGAVNVVTGVALLFFTGGLFSRIGWPPLTRLDWYTIGLLVQSAIGLIGLFVGIGLYLYAQE